MIFFYKCKSEDGLKEGYIDASSIKDASIKLEKRGLDVLELKEIIKSKSDVTFNSTIFPLNLIEKKSFYTSLSGQYKAGISFLEIFNNIIQATSSNNIRTLCFNIVKKLQKGDVFEDVINYYSKYLNETYSALIIAGYKSGKLENILKNIVLQVKEEERIVSTIKKKTTYPKIIFFLLIFATCVFAFFVFPAFNQTANGMSFTLTSILIPAIFKIGIVFGIVGFFVWNLYNNKNFQSKAVNWLISFKKFDNILKNYYFSIFFSTLSLACEAGLTISEAVLISKKLVKIKNIENELQKIQNMLEKGCEVATAFGVSELFIDYAISQISTGEKAGKLSKALDDISQEYKKNYTEEIDATLKLIEPTLIAVAAICLVILGGKMFSKYYETLFSLF